MSILKTFDHKGKTLMLTAHHALAEPARNPIISRADIKISALALKGDTLTAEIQGDRIAHIHSEILINTGEAYYGPVVREFIIADLEIETDGLLKPVWSSSVRISIALRPSMTLLTDGVNSAFAFKLPHEYRSSVCTLEGRLTTAQSHGRARMLFDGGGQIKDFIVYKQQGGRSIPCRINPKRGDTFAPFVQRISFENGRWNMESVFSNELTFDGRAFHLEKETLLPLDHLAGILVQDLEGGITRKYITMKL